MNRWTLIVVASALTTTSCLASKSDIRLIQDEIRLTRSQVGLVDTSIARQNEQRRQQIATLASTVDRLVDSVRHLNNRLNELQRNVGSELSALNGQVVQMQALLGQTTRNLQETQRKLAEIRDNAMASNPTTPAGGQPGVPAAITLLTSGIESLTNGAFGTARSSFELLLSSYPSSDEAPKAQLYIGQSFGDEGNTAAADSVYQLVPDKYPKTPEAGTALYRHGKYLCRNNKKGEGRIVLNKVIRDYPNSDEARLARDC